MKMVDSEHSDEQHGVRAPRSPAWHRAPWHFWNDNWSQAKPATAEPSARDGDQVGDRLLVTGHVLEWWALAPKEVQPPRKVLVSAAQWLVRTVETLPEKELQQNYAFLSHAARALALWRGREPAAVLRELSVDPGG